MRLLKFLKPYSFKLLVVIALIVMQAAANLALPSYMADIVDTGVSARGITEKAPKTIGKNDLESLFSADHEIFNYYHLENLSLPEVYIINSDENLLLAEPLFLEAFSGEESPKLSAREYIIKSYENIGFDFSKSQNSYILKYGTMMILVTFASMFCAIASGFVNSQVTAAYARDLRKAVFEKVLSFSNKEMDKFSVSSLITRSINDITQVQNFLTSGVRTLFFAPVMGIGALIQVVGTQSQMGKILAISLGVVMALIVVVFVSINKKFQLMQELTDKLNLVTRQSLTGITVVRAFSNEDYEEEKFGAVNSEITAVNKFIGKVMGSMFPVLMLIMNLTGIAIIYYGAKYVDQGFIQIGDIMAFIQYANNVIMSFIFFSMFSIMLPRAVVSIKRISEVLASETSIKEPACPKPLPANAKGKIEFKNVSFRYPGAEENVLENISFTVNPGETTAIIGTTGSGKSTLLNLALRLYDVSEGQVLLDGVDIRELSLSSIREKISFASQKALLFSGTIESNIKFALSKGCMEMERAAEIAQAKEFISEKEDKYNSEVSRGGSNLSGGQRQRVSIARAIYKPSDVIIFDDTFSALDYKTDLKLRQALASTIKNKAILIVAQRIATIRHANKILLMDEGKIIAQGTHEELIENSEVYRELASGQMGLEAVK